MATDPQSNSDIAAKNPLTPSTSTSNEMIQPAPAAPVAGNVPNPIPVDSPAQFGSNRPTPNMPTAAPTLLRDPPPASVDKMLWKIPACGAFFGAGVAEGAVEGAAEGAAVGMFGVGRFPPNCAGESAGIGLGTLPAGATGAAVDGWIISLLVLVLGVSGFCAAMSLFD